MVSKDDIETMRILFGVNIGALCNQSRFREAQEMEQIRDRLMNVLLEVVDRYDAVKTGKEQK